MPDNATTTPERLSDPVPAGAGTPLPGTRAALCRAAADALRAAAADCEDPRTTPLAGLSGARQAGVASWLRKRANLLEPAPLSAWQRNKLAVLDVTHPELPARVRTAVVEALASVAGQLAGYGVSLELLPSLPGELVEALTDVDAARQLPA